ncbi:anthranilate synthase component I [Bacillus sp. BGMRC 2118]|nr:anthranilate synthase component I [Bacillus sp. BGMRC 2118]
MSTHNEAGFLSDCLQYNTIPIVKTFFVDMLTPIQLFQVLKKEAVYLLESNDEQSKWSNYSFIGLSPFMTIEEENQQLHVKNNKSKSLHVATGIKEALSFVKETLNIKELDLELPFKGGAVGYIGYDAISSIEKVPRHQHNDLNLKTHYLHFCETILVFSHSKKELTFIHYVQLNGTETVEQQKEYYRSAISKIDEEYNKICSYNYQFESLTNPSDISIDFSKITSSYKKEAFLQHVNIIKEYILAGDVFQAVLSQRFELPLSISGFDVYRVLRVVNPSPYLFYINLGECEIVGSSPERLIQVQDGHLEIHPIAGTRRRGKSKVEDRQLGEELLNDKKEEAEHYMLLDLARNDIGRVAEYGSVQVPIQKELHYFSHVMHLVSKVTGRLGKQYTSLDALSASFPAGTVSGAPKVRAMQIIQELEPVARNVYAGTIAYIGFDGNIDSCIAIRTAVIKDQKAYVQAGAGIVADSIPELEYKETLNKASGVMKSILIAESMFSREENVQC